MKKKKKKYTRRRRIIVLRIKIAVFLAVVMGGILFLHYHGFLTGKWNKAVPAAEDSVDGTGEGEDIPKGSDIPDENKEPTTVPQEDKEEETNIKETSIYTFMQGPKAWNSKTPWSGEWCEEVLAGSKFSVFGCGLCDLANIYSTLSPYECSPLDMFHYAKEISDYNPGGGVGAIDWPYMQKTLETTGFTCELGNKDETYEQFCSKIGDSLTAIVLVSSLDDNTYWKETTGHYVNIWSYNEETQEVFLADSGDPEHNRMWIPLKYIYDALKTSGTYQYLLVQGYEESQNTWKHSGIKENWTIPDYYIPKQ